jgi:hypothetical protein
VILAVVVAVLIYMGRTGRLQPAKQKVTAGIRTLRSSVMYRGPRGGRNVS